MTQAGDTPNVPPSNVPPLMGLPNWFTETWWRFFNTASDSVNNTAQAAAGAATSAAQAQASANAAQGSATSALARPTTNVASPAQPIFIAYALSAMAITPFVLFPATQISTTHVTLFTASAVTIVTEIVFTNITNSPVHLTVFVVPNGGTAGNSNIMIGALGTGLILQSGQPYVAQELANLTMAVGDFIVAVCSAPNGINAIGSGWHL